MPVDDIEGAFLAERSVFRAGVRSVIVAVVSVTDV